MKIYLVITGIIAVAQDLAIGKDGKLPWHYPADLKFFKRTTTGNAIVMGANTWRSIGRPLPSRLSVVLSRTAEIKPEPNVLLMRSKAEVLALAKYLNGDLFIIGGAKTYESFAEDIDRWIVTRIPLRIDDADVYMPEDLLDGFSLTETRNLDEGLNVEFFRRRES